MSRAACGSARLLLLCHSSLLAVIPPSFSLSFSPSSPRHSLSPRCHIAPPSSVISPLLLVASALLFIIYAFLLVLSPFLGVMSSSWFAGVGFVSLSSDSPHCHWVYLACPCRKGLSVGFNVISIGWGKRGMRETGHEICHLFPSPQFILLILVVIVVNLPSSIPPSSFPTSLSSIPPSSFPTLSSSIPPSSFSTPRSSSSLIRLICLPLSGSPFTYLPPWQLCRMSMSLPTSLWKGEGQLGQQPHFWGSWGDVG